MFLFCYFGEVVTTAFEELSDEIYQCDWDTFSYKIRRILPNIMLVAQEPVHIQAHGGIRCTRDTFKKVISINIFL